MMPTDASAPAGSRGRSAHRFDWIGALLAALLVIGLGFLLSAWAHALASTLFEPGARLPTLREGWCMGPRSMVSLAPFALVAFFHLIASHGTAELPVRPQIAFIVVIDALAVTAVSAVFSGGSAAALIVLGLTLALGALVGHGAVFVARALRRGRRRGT